jgi:hypothetical protein
MEGTRFTQAKHNQQQSVYRYLLTPKAGGGVKTIKLHLRQLPITTDLIGDYSADEKYRQNFQAWVNQFWQEKDQCLHDFHLAAKE